MTNPSAQYLRDNVLWRVQLNDETIIYQNDIDGEPSSWMKLKHYLDENRDKYIINMHILFRDHYEHIGSNMPFFFFSFKILGQFGGGFPQRFYLAGCGESFDSIRVKHFIVPELLLSDEDIRDALSKQCNRGIIAHPDYISLFDDYYDEQKV